MTKCKDEEEGCFIWGKEKLSGGNRSVFSWSCNHSLNVIWTQQKTICLWNRKRKSNLHEILTEALLLQKERERENCKGILSHSKSKGCVKETAKLLCILYVKEIEGNKRTDNNYSLFLSTAGIFALTEHMQIQLKEWVSNQKKSSSSIILKLFWNLSFFFTLSLSFCHPQCKTPSSSFPFKFFYSLSFFKCSFSDKIRIWEKVM